MINKNIDLTEILKNCPFNTQLYSPIFGTVFLSDVEINTDYPIEIRTEDDGIEIFTKDGKYMEKGEIMLFPSKEQRDWSKFEYPKQKKPKFDPNTLKPFDKVLVKSISIYNSDLVWRPHYFSHLYVDKEDGIKIYTIPANDNCPFEYVIPYNEDTKNLVNTENEAPEYYRYWEY